MHGLAAKSLRTLFLTFALALMCFAASPNAGHGQQAAGTAQSPALEQFFPKIGNLLGVTPHDVQFAPDGKQAAFLHGGHELWLLDPATGKATLAVSWSKLEKIAANDKDTPKTLWGVASYTWSADSKEILFAYEGHVYRLTVASLEIERVSDLRIVNWDNDRRANCLDKVQYLPDGSGYVVIHGKAYYRQSVWVGSFSSKTMKAWTPRLPDQGFTADIQFSPDGMYFALTVLKGSGGAGPRDIYIAPITAMTQNEAITNKVYAAPQTGPADFVSQIDWSLDSSRIAFAHFVQKTGQIHIVAADIDGGPAQQAHTFAHSGSPAAQDMTAPWFLADHQTVVYVSEQTGFLQLQTLDVVSGNVSQLTTGSFEVYPVSMSADREELYVAATKEHATRRDLYRVDLTNGKFVRLTRGQGSYGDIQQYSPLPSHIINAAVSPDGQTVLSTFAALGTLRELVRIDLPAGEQKTLTSSHGPQALKLATARPEFFTYTNRHGHEIQALVYKPRNWQATDQRPALIYVYGGPIGIDKMVQDGAVTNDDLFAAYMAEKHGYVSVVIDPRGSSGYGADFEKSNYGKPGQAAVEDLEDAATYLVSNCGVDAKRIALHGWSFGGFVTQMCMYKSDKFAVGIAGAGPTEWNYYNTWYTSRTIGEPGFKGENLKKYSLVPLTKNLKGELLLVHGKSDNNVYMDDTWAVYGALIQAGKVRQIELFVDPRGGHGLGGVVFSQEKFQKYEQFLLERLGTSSRLPVRLN